MIVSQSGSPILPAGKCTYDAESAAHGSLASLGADVLEVLGGRRSRGDCVTRYCQYPIIIQDIADMSQVMWSSLTRRAGQIGNATDISGAALRQGVQERGARCVGAAAATVTATVVTAVVATTAAAAASSVSGNSNGERGHEGDEESGQLHFGSGKRTQRLKSNGVSVWQKTEDLLEDASDDDEKEKRTIDRGDGAFFYR